MPSFRDWVSEGDKPPLMGMDDPFLERRTNDLRRQSDDLDAQSEELDRRAAAVRESLAHARGTGTAEDGAVTVEVDAQHAVVDIRLTPKAMRLQSTDRLAEALLTAVRQAERDVDEQLAAAAGDLSADPLEAFLKAVPEVAAVIPPDLLRPRRRTDEEPDS